MADDKSTATGDRSASSSASTSSPAKSSSSKSRSTRKTGARSRARSSSATVLSTSTRSGDAAENKGGSRSDPKLMSGVDRALEEVREVLADNERRARLHNRTVVHHEIVARDKDGNEKSKPIELHAIGQRGYMNTHGEAILDKEGLLELQQKVMQALEAVR